MKHRYGLCCGVIVRMFILMWMIVSSFTHNVFASPSSVAIVNGSLISYDDYKREVDQTRIQISKRQVTPPNESELSAIKKMVLEHMIDRELLYQQSQKVGIKVSTTEIDERMALIKNRFTDEAEYRNMLQEEDLTEDHLKIQLRRGIAREQFINKQIIPNVVVTDKEVQSFYDKNPQFFKKPEQVKASHILIKMDPEADELRRIEARNRIEQIQQKLSQGEDFATLAKAFSECPSSTNGGDLGYFGRGRMVKSFEDAAFALEPEKVSDVVHTQFGLHLIKVFNRQPESMYAFEKVKDMIFQELNNRKILEAETRYIEKLKKDALIKRFIE